MGTKDIVEAFDGVVMFYEQHQEETLGRLQ